MDIGQVMCWIVERGVSHVVTEAQSGWVHTICNTVWIGSDMKSSRGDRVCKKCRERLKTATLIDSGEHSPKVDGSN